MIDPDQSNFAADIPASLAEADEVLTRYGRWAADSGRQQRRCGSAEGGHIPTSWHAVERRRAPTFVGLTQIEALCCQRALARVPDQERIVLSILYIPRRHPVELQLRLLRVPPRICQERHLRGLRFFDNLHRIVRYTAAHQIPRLSTASQKA